MQSAKKWYSRAININHEIDRLIEKRSMTYSEALKVTPTYSNMPKAHNVSDSLQSTIDRICGIDSEINAKIDQLYTVKREILAAIDNIESKTDKECVRLRYVDMLSWNEIAKRLGIPRRSVAYNVERGINDTTYCINA